MLEMIFEVLFAKAGVGKAISEDQPDYILGGAA